MPSSPDHPPRRLPSARLFANSPPVSATRRPRPSPSVDRRPSSATPSLSPPPSAPPSGTPPSSSSSWRLSQRHVNSRPSSSAFPTVQRGQFSNLQTASRQHALSTLGSLSSFSLGASLSAPDVWASLAEDNLPTADISTAGALAIKTRTDMLLELSPAQHLVTAAHGDVPAEVVAHLRLWRAQRMRSDARGEYAGHVLNFLRWADDLDVPVYLRFPTHPNILHLFFSSVAPFYAESTLNKMVSALQAWHLFHALPWGYDRVEAKTVRQAFARLCVPPLALRRPARVQDFAAMRKRGNFDPVSGDRAHAALYACALFAFWSMARLGELTVSVASRPEPQRPRRRDLSFVRDPSNPTLISSVLIHLPRDKTHPSGFDRVVASQPHHLPLCPVRALLWHLHLNPAPDDAGVFAYLDRDGTLRELRGQLVKDTINSWLFAEGREPLDGHSFRIGGATLLHAHDIPIERIKVLGGWASDAALLYLRDVHAKHAEVCAGLSLSLPSLSPSPPPL